MALFFPLLALFVDSPLQKGGAHPWRALLEPAYALAWAALVPRGSGRPSGLKLGLTCLVAVLSGPTALVAVDIAFVAPIDGEKTWRLWARPARFFGNALTLGLAAVSARLPLCVIASLRKKRPSRATSRL